MVTPGRKRNKEILRKTQRKEQEKAALTSGVGVGQKGKEVGVPESRSLEGRSELELTH